MIFLKQIFVLLFCVALSASATEVTKTIIIGGSTYGLRDYKQQDIQVGVSTALDERLLLQGVKTKTIVYQSNEDLEDAVRNNEIDIFFGTPLQLLSLEDSIDTTNILSGIV